RQLPDKAVSVLDTACARLALGQQSIPAAIEDATRTLEDLAVQTRVLERETAVGSDHRDRLDEIAAKRTATEARLKELTGRWDRERDLVNRIREIRTQLEPPDPAVAAPPAAPAAAGVTTAAAAATPADGAAAAAQPALD